MQNSTENTVAVVHQASDTVYRQIRIRIWKRAIRVYLPIIFRDYQSQPILTPLTIE